MFSHVCVLREIGRIAHTVLRSHVDQHANKKIWYAPHNDIYSYISKQLLLERGIIVPENTLKRWNVVIYFVINV